VFKADALSFRQDSPPVVATATADIFHDPVDTLPDDPLPEFNPAVTLPLALRPVNSPWKKMILACYTAGRYSGIISPHPRHLTSLSNLPSLSKSCPTSLRCKCLQVTVARLFSSFRDCVVHRSSILSPVPPDLHHRV